MEGKALHDFDFENLDVYQQSLSFVDRLFTLCESFPVSVDRTLGDQLRRASVSIPNNIAEGSNKLSKKAKAQFYGYALDSARECIPMLTIVFRRKLMSEGDHGALRSQCLSACRMLRGLIRSIS